MFRTLCITGLLATQLWAVEPTKTPEPVKIPEELALRLEKMQLETHLLEERQLRMQSEYQVLVATKEIKAKLLEDAKKEALKSLKLDPEKGTLNLENRTAQ